MSYFYVSYTLCIYIIIPIVVPIHYLLPHIYSQLPLRIHFSDLYPFMNTEYYFYWALTRVARKTNKDD